MSDLTPSHSAAAANPAANPAAAGPVDGRLRGLLRRRQWRPRRPGWCALGFALLLPAALALRLWELTGRAMHYDEAIHLYYAWQLSNFEEYIHSPWMHGPFQIELTAALLLLLGDNDFVARLGYALFGTALVGLPWLLRRPLGQSGALLTGIMLAVSPALLYFSRFGRNDILMAFLTAALFLLMWRYFQERRNRYLYLAAAALALMFATKETAYIITLVFGGLALLTALTTFGLWVRDGDPYRLSWAAGAGGFLLLLLTLTLPQWSAGFALFQDWLGLTLANRDGVVDGIVGAPQWEGPFVPLPLFAVPPWLHWLALLPFLGIWMGYAWKSFADWPRRWAGVGIPVAMADAGALALLRPVGGLADGIVAGIIAAVAVGALLYLRIPWKKGLLLLAAPFLMAAVYVALLLPVVQVEALLGAALPDGVRVAVEGNAVPVNFVVAGGILAATALLSLIIGLRWKGGVWLVCAAIFYLIWTALYTTFYSNGAGLFSGSWQGMGYWIAQQEVARGNQPWYYYLVGLSVYELLPIIFGVIGAAVFLRRRDGFGLALTLWAGVNLLAYTIASEKMPWLLVNITLPFIFLAGKLLGEWVEAAEGRRLLQQGRFLLLFLPPLALIGFLYVLLAYTDNAESAAFSLTYGTVLVGAALLAVAAAGLIRRAGKGGAALAGLGLAALLLIFTGIAAARAAYTYDDSRVEILVYAQGGADLTETYQKLSSDVINGRDPAAVAANPVAVDYDLWFPFQWYVRHWKAAEQLRFACFKTDDSGGCQPPQADAQAAALLLTAAHRYRGGDMPAHYRQEGPKRNLLWFPESYRRPGENRPAEGPLTELRQDLAFFRAAATNRDLWRQSLRYLLFRELSSDWFTAEYYSYWPRAAE